MWGDFKHLIFKNFLMVPLKPNLVFFSLPTKALNIHNSYMSATPKVGVHLGVIGLHPLHSPPICESVFHT
jgi:hypothetical protein